MPGFYLPSEDEFDPSTDDFVLPVVSKERKYKHFDLPLKGADREQVIDFSAERRPHRFLPLIGFTDETRRYVRSASGVNEIKIKKRPIRFASHADAAYLQAYAEHLNRYYEQSLTEASLSASVLAYRKGGGTNIHHEKELFDEIRRRGDCCVFAMDISGFFDCLDHLMLRDELAGLIGATRLEGHHATIWKSVTATLGSRRLTLIFCSGVNATDVDECALQLTLLIMFGVEQVG